MGFHVGFQECRGSRWGSGLFCSAFPALGLRVAGTFLGNCVAFGFKHQRNN